LDELKSGIYKITCNANKMIYIGQSKDIKRRFSHHKYTLKKNKSHNKHLQYAWNKYGKDDFDFEIIEMVDMDEIDEREKYWIEYYDSYKQGFNQTEGGSGIGHNNKVYKYTGFKDNKQKIIANLNTGERFYSFEELNKRYKISNPYYFKNIIDDINAGIRFTAIGYYWCYDYYGIDDNEELQNRIKLKEKSFSLKPIKIINITTGEIFESINEAGKYYNIPNGQISNCINKKVKSAHGYVFMRYDEYVENGKNFNEYNIKIKKIKKQVININTGKIYPSIKNASEETKISKSSISSCCRHKIKNAGGYQWEFYYDGIDMCNIELRNPRNYKKKKVININTNIIYNNANQAAKALGLRSSSILNVCKGKQKTCGGHVWEYYKEEDDILN